jgi:hypothetical protein
MELGSVIKILEYYNDRIGMISTNQTDFLSLLCQLFALLASQVCGENIISYTYHES